MFGDILQPTHLLLILVVALLVLGPKRLPEVGKTLGSGLRDFRSAINGESHDRHEERAEPEPAPLHRAADVPASATDPAPVAASATDPAPVAASTTDPAPVAADTQHGDTQHAGTQREFAHESSEPAAEPRRAGPDA